MQNQFVGVPELPPHFLPRPEDITLLKLVLLSYVSKVLITGTTWRVGVQSIGGIGKTVLAAAVVRDEEIRQTFPDGIFWVHIGQSPRISLKQFQLARALGDTTGIYTEEQEGRARLGRLLKDRGCLLVLDDVWELEHLIPFDALGQRCRMLVTTRNADLVQKTGGAEHRMYVMNDEQALRLLSLWTGVGMEKLPAPASRLARECGNVPLALAMIGAIIRENPTRWNGVLHRLRSTDLEKLGKKFPDYPYPNLMRAIHVSVESLERHVQQHYLSLAIFPEEIPVPEHVVQMLWKADGLNDEEIQDTFDTLMARSLIAVDEEWRVRLHDVQLEYICRQAGNVRTLHHMLIEAVRETLLPLEHPTEPSNDSMPDNDHAETLPSSAHLWASLPPDEHYMWNALTYHLTEAGHTKEIQDILCNFAWIEAKLHATDINNLIADFDRCRDIIFERDEEDEVALQLSSLDSLFLDFDPELPPPNTQTPAPPPHLMIRDTLRLAAPVLVQDKSQLAGQLIGRLRSLEGSPSIQTMLDAITARSDHQVSWLYPLTASLTPPGRQLLQTIESASDVPVAVALTAYGRYAVTASDLNVKVWDMEYGELRATLEGHTDRVWAVAVTADGRKAVSVSADKTLRVWDIEQRCELVVLESHAAGVWSVALTTDGRRAISASDDMTLKVWDIEQGQLITTLEGHDDRVRAVALSSDGQRAVSGSDDGRVYVWDVEQNRLLASLEGHHDWVRAVAITPDGCRVATGSVDRVLHVWDVEQREVIARLEGHSKEILAVAMTADGRKVVSASSDTTLKVWNVERKALVRTLEGHTAGVNSVALTLDGQHAVSTAYDGTLRMWNVGRVQIPSSVEGHEAGVIAITALPDRPVAISASHDNTLKIWNTASGGLLRTIHVPRSALNAMAVLPDSKQILSASYDEPLRVWNLESGTMPGALANHEDWIMAVALLPGGARAVSVSDEHFLSLWDLETGERIQTLELQDYPGGFSNMHVLSDGQRLLLGAGDGSLCVYSMLSGSLLQMLPVHSAKVTGLALRKHEQQVISASADGTVKRWDLASGSLLGSFAEQVCGINSIALSPDEQYVAVACEDGTLKVWDIETTQIVASFTAEGPLISCGFGMNGIIVVGEELGRMHFVRLVLAQR